MAARPALFCELLRLSLGKEPDFQVVGTAHDRDEIRGILKDNRPRVLIFDYEGLGPGAEGTLQRLRRAAPATRIVVLATSSSDETIERVLRAGASGFVDKQQPFATLVRAIRSVMEGELWANRRALAHVVEQLTESDETLSPEDRLTRREREITGAVGQGLRNKDIAHLLKINEKTVKSHLNNIFRKLQVDNRFAVGLYSLDRLRPRT